MKRIFLSIASALFALGAAAQAAAPRPVSSHIVTLPKGQQADQVPQSSRISSDQRWFGLYDSDALAQFGRGFPQYPGDNKAAISLKEEMLQAHVGSKVVGIRFGLCEPIGTSRVFIFACDRYGNGEDIVSQVVADTQVGWNTVMLDHPITITTKPGEEWLVGFDYQQLNDRIDGEYTSDCYPLSCVAEGATGQLLNLYYERLGTGAGKAWYESNLEDYNLSVQLLIQGNYHQYDVSVNDFGSLAFKMGTEVTVPVRFSNNSTEDVKSLDYVVTLDGVAGAEQHIDFETAIAPSHDGSFSVALPVGETAGTHDVAIEISKVNGNANESESKVSKGTVSVYADKYPRNLVIEEFTTEQCPNCPRVASLLHYYLETADPARVYAVCHHSAYHTDWLTQDCDLDLTYLFNDNGTTYAPALMFNRQPDFNALYWSGNMDNVLFPQSYDDIEGYANYQLSLLSDAQLAMQVTVDKDSTVATLTVSGECNESLDQGQNLLTVYLTEDDITAHDQYGASGLYYHQHVIRYYNSSWGDPIVWENNRFTTTYSIPIDPSWKKNDLHFVAFLNKHNTADKLDNRIENSVGMSFANAVTAVTAAKDGREATEVARYNAAGQRIDGPQKGLNIIRLSDGRTQKVVVR